MRRSIYLLVLSLVLLVAGCAEEEARPIRLGMLPITDNLPFWVAEEKGYFEQLHVKVELVGFDSAMRRDAAITGGQIDGALGDILAVSLLNNGGTKVKIVSLGQGVTAEEGRFSILAAPNSNITSVQDLKGEGIGCSLKTIQEYVLDNLLTSNGFREEEIKKVAIPDMSLRFSSLLEGSIKAAILPDPLAALAETKGARLLLDDTRENISQTVIYFREDILNRDMDAVRKIMRAYARAVEDIAADPGAFNNILATKARTPEEVLVSKEHGMRLLFSPPTLPGEDQIQRVQQWMVRRGLLARPFTYADLVESRVLNP
ncbi:MAG: MetQ/NlpA family ABC transporter substrate-binding protein [Desulfotomaculales bacterium]